MSASLDKGVRVLKEMIDAPIACVIAPASCMYFKPPRLHSVHPFKTSSYTLLKSFS